MPNMNDPADLTFYYTAPLFLPCTIEDPNFLGVYSSTSDLPTTASSFNTAGVAGTGSMYVYLNNAWQYIGQYLYDAYRYLVYYQGSAFTSASGTKWTSIFNDIASNSDLMTEFAENSTATTNFGASSVAMTAVVASSTAMNAFLATSMGMNVIAASPMAMQTVGNSSTYMSAILPSSAYANIWWGSSYYVGLGFNTYTGLGNPTLAGLNTISDIVGNSTAMSAILGSSEALSTIAASSTAMSAIIVSYSAMNAMTTLTVAQTLQSASATISVIETLISNIISGSTAITTGNGSSTALGVNPLLVLLSYNNGAALTANYTNAFSLAQKIYNLGSSAYSSAGAGYEGTTLLLTVATNQIVFILTASRDGKYGFSVGTSSSNTSNIFTGGSGSPTAYVGSACPLLFSGTTLYESGGDDAYSSGGNVYYATYTP
ncbi:MAG: hypothetical protein M1542_08580 [Thermotogae bacterium]|nr:hypothetical protein [Thermotogota bacterium]